MAAIADNGQAHILVLLVVAHQFLKVLGQVLELRLACKARLQQLRLYLHLVLEVSEGGALQMFGVLLGRKCRLSGVMVVACKFMEAAGLAKVLLVLLLCLGLLVDGHSVLHEIAARAEFRRSLLDPPEVLFLVGALVLRHEAAPGFVVEAAGNLLLEALGCVDRVALAIEVFRVDPRNEASVAWDALVADLVHRAIHPRAARLRHIADGSLLVILLK